MFSNLEVTLIIKRFYLNNNFFFKYIKKKYPEPLLKLDKNGEELIKKLRKIVYLNKLNVE